MSIPGFSADLLLPAPAAGGGEDITTGLVGHWLLDEGSGTTANDSAAGGASDGTVAGSPTWGADYLSFDGSDDVVNISNQTPFDFEWTDPFTVTGEVWYDSTLNAGSMVTKMTAFSGWWVRSIAFVGTMGFGMGVDGGSNMGIEATQSVMVHSTWYKFAATYDGSGDPAGMEMYLDGSILGKSSSSGSITTGTIIRNTDVRIGADDWNWNGRHIGRFRNVRIYNRELTAAQVAAL